MCSAVPHSSESLALLASRVSDDCLPIQDKEVFTDTTSLPIIRKKLRKVERQGEMESKRKWQNVTKALLADDVEAASAAKHEVRCMVLWGSQVKCMVLWGSEVRCMVLWGSEARCVVLWGSEVRCVVLRE